MKKIIFSTAMLFAATFATQAQQPATPAANPNQAEIQFEEESHEFGNIKEGTMATFEFKFKNTGKEPLVLSNVQASCGCTTPSWTREPIAPGKSGVVTATYNSNGRPGSFSKSITVTSNAKSGQKVLTIRGFVEQNAPQPTQPQSPIVNPTPCKP
jgi:hypothetical protein